MSSLRTNVYIDGFNFYYGRVKNSPYKWLNLRAMCETILPNNNIETIKYFTAHVKQTLTDPGKPVRQNAYFRALKTLDKFEIILGHFLTNSREMPRTGSNPIQWVTVDKTEEKGSDVNMATHLLVDGFKNNFDIAVVVTNDSDLKEPMKVLKEEFGKTVLLLNPHHQRRFSDQLARYADWKKKILEVHIKNCQFPDKLVDKNGEFFKPSSW